MMKARSRIKAGKILCTKQLVKQIINARQRVAVLNCDLVESTLVHHHPELTTLLLHKLNGCAIGTGRGLDELL